MGSYSSTFRTAIIYSRLIPGGSEVLLHMEFRMRILVISISVLESYAAFRLEPNELQSNGYPSCLRRLIGIYKIIRKCYGNRKDR